MKTLGVGLLVIMLAVLFLPQANAVIPITVNGVLEITRTQSLLHTSAGIYALSFSVAPPRYASMNWFYVQGTLSGTVIFVATWAIGK